MREIQFGKKFGEEKERKHGRKYGHDVKVQTVLHRRQVSVGRGKKDRHEKKNKPDRNAARRKYFFQTEFKGRNGHFLLYARKKSV